MSLWGFRITRKSPKVESEEIKELHQLLKEEKKKRGLQEKQAAEAKLKLEEELKEAKKAEKERIRFNTEANAMAALVQLRIAERYEVVASAPGLSKSRYSSLQAIIDKRVEAAEHLLGFEIDDISTSINFLEQVSNGS